MIAVGARITLWIAPFGDPGLPPSTLVVLASLHPGRLVEAIDEELEAQQASLNDVGVEGLTLADADVANSSLVLGAASPQLLVVHQGEDEQAEQAHDANGDQGLNSSYLHGVSNREAGCYYITI